MDKPTEEREAISTAIIEPNPVTMEKEGAVPKILPIKRSQQLV